MSMNQPVEYKLDILRTLFRSLIFTPYANARYGISEQEKSALF